MSRKCSFTSPCSVNTKTCAKVLNCRPMRPPLYWMKYDAWRVSIGVPSMLMDWRRAWRVESTFELPSASVVSPQAYLMTPKSTVCSISTGLSLWGSNPIQIVSFQVHRIWYYYSLPSRVKKGFIYFNSFVSSISMSEVISRMPRNSRTVRLDSSCSQWVIAKSLIPFSVWSFPISSPRRPLRNWDRTSLRVSSRVRGIHGCGWGGGRNLH